MKEENRKPLRKKARVKTKNVGLKIRDAISSYIFSPTFLFLLTPQLHIHPIAIQSNVIRHSSFVNDNRRMTNDGNYVPHHSNRSVPCSWRGLNPKRVAGL